MKANNKQILHINLQDVRPYANASRLGTGELYIVDDLQRVDIEHRVLQTSFLTIALCTEGSTTCTFNGQELTLCKNDLFIGLGNQIIENAHHSPDFKMIAMLQSHQFAQEVLHSMLHLWPYLLHLIETPVVSLSEHETQWLLKGYRLLLSRLSDKRHTFLRQSVSSFLQVFYLDVCHMLEQRYPQSQVGNSRSYGIFYNFMTLLMTKYKSEREVSWYADQLELTPKYLSEMVKSVSGRTVSYWISMMVTMEIKSLLRNSDMSIRQIAELMNFSNQSFMGKYFKNITGVSPLEYRQRI